MLTKDQLQGIWVSVPTEWDEHGAFDERTFRDQIALLIEAGVDGLYTTGSTGEFYALDWEEYKQVTTAFLDEAAGKVPIQVGANWFNTRDTIRRACFARDRGAGAAQVCFPAWMRMRQEDYEQFLVDISEAAPDIALIHYNVAHTKKLFRGADYAQVLPRAPTLIGSKAAVSINDFMELVVNAPQMNHFTSEYAFLPGYLLGAKGMYTSWFMMNPAYFHAFYCMCLEGRYEQAAEVTHRLTRWHETAVTPLIDKGYLHPTLDKAFVELAGWLPGNRRTRKPHQPLSDADFAELKSKTRELMPEFLEYRP